VADPTIDAASEILDESLTQLRQAIDGLSASVLDARPGSEDTNSLAVLVTHALHSTRAWLSLAVGAPLPDRDRPAEFATTVGDDVDGFMAGVDAVSADCRRLLDDAGPYDPGRTGTAPWRGGELATEPVTAAWALIHALVHLREHVGHAELTRQLRDQGATP
jgi:hypothetical protein